MGAHKDYTNETRRADTGAAGSGARRVKDADGTKSPSTEIEIAAAASRLANPALGFHTGERIQLLRRQRGMNQESFAKAVGVSRSFVAEWETNRGGELDYLERIAEVLGVPTEIFLNEMASHETQETVTIDEAELLRRYRCRDVRGKLMALRFLVLERSRMPGMPGKTDARAEAGVPANAQADSGHMGAAPPPVPAPNLVEIDLPNGARLRIIGEIDASMLRRALLDSR